MTSTRHFVVSLFVSSVKLSVDPVNGLLSNGLASSRESSREAAGFFQAIKAIEVKGPVGDDNEE